MLKPDATPLNNAVDRATEAASVEEGRAQAQHRGQASKQNHFEQPSTSELATRFWAGFLAPACQPEARTQDHEVILNGWLLLHCLRLTVSMNDAEKPICWMADLQIQSVADPKLISVAKPPDEEAERRFFACKRRC